MVRNRSYVVIGIILIVLAGSGPALGQGGKLSELLAPFVNEQTLGVVAIDVARLDVDATFDVAESVASKIMGAEQMEDVTAELQKARGEFKEGFGGLKEGGVTMAYVLWSLDDLQDPIYAVPLGAGGTELESWLNENVRLGDDAHVRRGGVMFIGDKQIMERRKGEAVVVRPELDKAMAAAGDAMIKVLLVPNADSRRVIEGMLPLLLEQGIKVPANTIMDGFQWGAIGVDLPPKMSLKMQVKSADAASAKALMGLWGAVSGFFGQAPELKEIQPSLSAALDMFKPEAVGAGLRLALDEGQCVRLVTDVLVPPLAKVRGEALRIKCGTNLSDLGRAILIYAHHHEDKLPPNLEVLIGKEEIALQTLVCGSENYVYRGVDLGDLSVEPGHIVVHDAAGNHKEGRNVLFLDSHVEWVTEDEFQELVEKDNAMRRRAGLQLKPAQ